MPLELNLLHEEFTEKRQRKRDPLKLGMMALGAIGALMLAIYMLKAYQTLAFKQQLGGVEEEWAKVEPKVTLAQKRAEELTEIIDATDVLSGIIENRFLWGPLLETIAGCVAPNIQLTSFDGTVNDDKLARLSIEGVAAGEEPRAAAEEFRQLLSEKLGERYQGVDVEFKNLEDVDTPVLLGGVSLKVARYAITISLRPQSATNSNSSSNPTPGAKGKK